MDKQNSGRGRYILKQLSQHYTLHWIDIGDDARLSKSGFVFDISVYEIEDIGHLCISNFAPQTSGKMGNRAPCMASQPQQISNIHRQVRP